MGKQVLATLVAAVACLALWGGVSAQQAESSLPIVLPGDVDVVDSPAPEISQTPVAPVAGTGHRSDPETYAQGVVVIVMVMGLAVGGSLAAAALRSRRG